jgi:hypothetical protein
MRRKNRLRSVVIIGPQAGRISEILYKLWQNTQTGILSDSQFQIHGSPRGPIFTNFATHVDRVRFTELGSSGLYARST